MLETSKDIKNFHIIDDDDVDRYLVKRCVGVVLKDVPTYEHSSAESFLDFIDKTATGEFPQSQINQSLVTMDLRMPGIGGLEALNRIEERIKKGMLAVDAFYCLVLTSSNSKHDRVEVKDFSFVNRYVVKPMTVELLQEIIDSCSQ